MSPDTRPHNREKVHREEDSDSSAYDPNLLSQSTISYESHGAVISNARLLNAQGSIVNILQRGKPYVFTYDVRFNTPLQGVRFSFLLKTVRGIELGGIASNPDSFATSDFAAGTVVTASFPFKCLLTADQYFLNAGVLTTINGEDVFAHRILDLHTFHVQPVAQDTVTGVIDFGVEQAISIVHHQEEIRS